MTSYLTALKLTDAELARLDGHCEPATQAAVDSMRARHALAAELAGAGLTDGQVRLVHAVVEHARVNGALSYAYASLNRCGYCDAVGGYAPHKRSGRYHRKGDPDHKRPTYVGGIDYGQGFVTMRGYATVGACRACCEAVNPAILARLATMPTALPAHFPGAPTYTEATWGGGSRTRPRLVRCDIRQCSGCRAIQHEGEMRMLPAIMEGYYRGGCRSCGIERRPLGPDPFATLPGWVVWDAQGRRVVRSGSEHFAVTP